MFTAEVECTVKVCGANTNCVVLSTVETCQCLLGYESANPDNGCTGLYSIQTNITLTLYFCVKKSFFHNFECACLKNKHTLSLMA